MSGTFDTGLPWTNLTIPQQNLRLIEDDWGQASYGATAFGGELHDGAGGHRNVGTGYLYEDGGTAPVYGGRAPPLQTPPALDSRHDVRKFDPRVCLKLDMLVPATGEEEKRFSKFQRLQREWNSGGLPAVRAIVVGSPPTGPDHHQDEDAVSIDDSTAALSSPKLVPANRNEPSSLVRKSPDLSASTPPQRSSLYDAFSASKSRRYVIPG